MRRLLVLLAVEACLCAPVGAAPTTVLSAASCPASVDFERAGYTVRRARLEGPFAFLGWIRAGLEAAGPDVSALNGRPYREAEVLGKAGELEQMSFLPAPVEQRVRVSLIVVSVEQCSDAQLDVVYAVFSSQIAPVLSGTFESRRLEPASPQRVAGADAERGRLRLFPGLGYDRGDGLFAGGRLEYRLPPAGARLLPLDAIVLEGRGSGAMHEVSAALTGATDDAADWLAHVDWQLDYLDASKPTERSELRTNRLAAQLAAITAAFGPLPVSLRFGGLLEGGRLDSDFRTSALGPDTVAGSDYGAVKLYLGTTTRLDHHVLAASYGIQLGSLGPDGRIDWIKHIGDVAHEVAVPLGDHRALTVESRLTGGVLQVPGSVPVAARFFGGNREEPFIPGDAWSIRGSPVVRSLPTNRLDRTRDGAGGTRFFAYNLTAAFPVWRRPLVPSELSRDPKFTEILNGQLVTATSAVQTGYISKDASFQAAAARIPAVLTELASLQAAVEAAEAGAPAEQREQFQACTGAIRRADGRARRAAEAKNEAQVGRLAALLTVDPDEDRLRKVRAACVTDLDARLTAAELTAAADRLEQIRLDMEAAYARIDQAQASRRAQTEMAFVRRTVNTLVHELNLVSVSPVLMFDVAHLGPADERLGTRYGIGGGLRVSLASSVDFTAGYLANPRRLPGEPAGAFFFSMQFKDIFQ